MHQTEAAHGSDAAATLTVADCRTLSRRSSGSCRVHVFARACPLRAVTILVNWIDILSGFVLFLSPTDPCEETPQNWVRKCTKSKFSVRHFRSVQREESCTNCNQFLQVSKWNTLHQKHFLKNRKWCHHAHSKWLNMQLSCPAAMMCESRRVMWLPQLLSSKTVWWWTFPKIGKSKAIWLKLSPCSSWFSTSSRDPVALPDKMEF